MPERNPFEETRQAAQNWSPREQYISRSNQDRMHDATVNRFIQESRGDQQRWEQGGGQGPYPVFNEPGTGANFPVSPGWLEASSGRDNSGIMAADAGNIMNKYKQFTDTFGDFDIGRDGIEYEKDFDVPWGGTGTAGNIMNKYKQFTDTFGDFDIGRDGIEYEKDFDVPWGGTGTFEGWGGGDDYGVGINFNWPLGQSAALDRGIGSTDEYQMAELRPEQIEHMQASDPSKTFLTRQELFQQIKDMEDKGSKGFLGFGARDPQEPTTWDEFNEKYDWLEGGGSPYGSEPHTKSYWIT